MLSRFSRGGLVGVSFAAVVFLSSHSLQSQALLTSVPFAKSGSVAISRLSTGQHLGIGVDVDGYGSNGRQDDPSAPGGDAGARVAASVRRERIDDGSRTIRFGRLSSVSMTISFEDRGRVRSRTNGGHDRCRHDRRDLDGIRPGVETGADQGPSGRLSIRSAVRDSRRPMGRRRLLGRALPVVVRVRFQIIVTSPRLDALARTADARAIRLDQREAPQREIARQKTEAEAARASQEKARLANKAVFRP